MEPASERDYQAQRLVSVNSAANYAQAVLDLAKQVDKAEVGSGYFVHMRLTLAIDRLIVLLEQKADDG